jgi:radical SAM-linked protein
MLSKDKMSYPKLDEPRTVRVKFRKVGNLQYISHLDLQRTVSRVLVRANIPMWYTQGFNPHAKVVFGLPLSVGTESECEFIDLRVDRNIPCEEVKNLLNRELTEEMQVLDAYEPTTKFADIAWARYEIALNFAGANTEMAEKLQALFTTSPLLVMKKSKSGEKEVDLTQMIRQLDASCIEDGKIAITAVLRAGNTENLNPEMLISAAKERLGILSGDPTQESYSILRTNVYTDDGVTEFK